MACEFAEEQEWPEVQQITPEHLEHYLAYLRQRDRWFGAQRAHAPKKLSRGYSEAQYRRLNRFFNCMVQREWIPANPLNVVPRPKLVCKVVQVQQMLDLVDPALARTPIQRFNLLQNRAVLYLLFDIPGRRGELNQYQGGMCISGVSKTTVRTPRYLIMTFRPRIRAHRQCGLAICTFHLGFSTTVAEQRRVESRQSRAGEVRRW